MPRRRPSEYTRDIYFTSQPLETSNLKLTQATMAERDRQASMHHRLADKAGSDRWQPDRR